ncbi:PAS domain S-box protein, partial [bacterium]|nr:PAS domain S-box protein [bacterium]
MIDAIAERLGRIIDRWNAEKELRIKEEAIASAINAITIADIKGNLTYVNRSFLNLWGYDEDKEILGKPVTELLQEEEKALEVMEVLRKKKSWIGELVARRKDGSTFDVQLLASTVRDEVGEAICFMASLVDITERKKIEQMKDDFVSLASHELRTPLTSIGGYVDLILDGDVGEINKEQKEFLEIISQNTQRLEALINDVLDIEKIESGRIKMKREKVNLNEIVEVCIDTFKVMAEGKGLKLEKEIKAAQIEVLGDSDRLSQVLSNLLSNAIKYSKEGRVKISAGIKGEFASVAVEDTGLGMSSEDMKIVFSRFFRAEDSYVRRTTGSGLGLSIAKATIERHNGDIKVESKLGAGSKFEV